MIRLIVSALQVIRTDRALAAVTCILALASLGGALAIMRLENDLVQSSRYNKTFDVAQTAVTLLRLEVELAGFALGQPSIGPDTLDLRLSIMENQLSVIQLGEASRLISDDAVSGRFVRGLAQAVAEARARLPGITPAVATELAESLRSLNADVTRMMAKSHQSAGDRVMARQKALETGIATICALFGCLVASGLVHTIMVMRRSAHFKKLAKVDVLTGLANRRAFSAQLDSAARNPQRPDLGILLLDIDQFKQVNDTMGHVAGDVLLATVGMRLAGLAGPSTTIARLGGDEFAALVDGPDIDARVGDLAVAIARAVNEPVSIDGRIVQCGASLGSAIARHASGPLPDLLRQADLALYAAKEAGRGRHCVFDRGMQDRVSARRDLANDLREACGRGELRVAFQPIVSAVSCQVVGAEALMRWQHPARGAVSPDLFIPVAEELGLIEELGVWILREACREAASWPTELRVAVNLSARQFEAGTLVAAVQKALDEFGVAPQRLELEVTESLLLKEENRVSTQLAALRRMGIRISLDDFGTGYTSLSYLHDFPVDKLKIDRSFVRNLPRQNRSQAIVEAICGLARRLGIVTVAEGVETDDQLIFVRAAGCSEAQGYLFARPLPAPAFRDLIEASGRAAAKDDTLAA